MPKIWSAAGAAVACLVLYILFWRGTDTDLSLNSTWIARKPASPSGRSSFGAFGDGPANTAAPTGAGSRAATEHPQLRLHRYTHLDISLVNVTSLFDSYESTLDRPQRSLLKHAIGRNAFGSRVIPYYYKKTGSFHAGDVTLITWLTSDRLGRLVRLAEKRRAPLSVAYFIPSNPRLATRDLALLDRVYNSHPALSSNVDLHLVTSDFKLQQNTWRNVARIFTQTDWILLWDADFEPCTDYQRGLETFRRNAVAGGGTVELDSGNAALVIPAFEWASPVPSRKYGFCPATKKQLHRHFEALEIDAFESYKPLLSHATQYPLFFSSGPTEYYAIEDYEFGYEAYMILRADAPVWFDERFAGFGWDRSAFTAHLYIAGVNLYVLPDQWAVHQEHPSFRRPASGIPSDEGENMRAWHSFRMDTCHQYGTVLANQGLLHHETGARLMDICADDDEQEIFYEMQRLLASSIAFESDRQEGFVHAVDPGFG